MGRIRLWKEPSYAPQEYQTLGIGYLGRTETMDAIAIRRVDIEPGEHGPVFYAHQHDCYRFKKQHFVLGEISQGESVKKIVVTRR